MKNKNKIKRILMSILTIISLVGFVIIPFLDYVKYKMILEVLWYISFIILMLNIIFSQSNKTKKNVLEFPESFKDKIYFIINNFTKVTIFALIYFLCSIFIINYYKPKFYDIEIMIFVLIAIIFSVSIYKIFKLKILFNNTPGTKKNIFINQMITSIIFYLLLDLLYISVVKGKINIQYTVGILLVLIVFWNSTKAFIKNKRPSMFFIIQDALVGLGISTYLIFKIENPSLQSIITTVASAVFGGYITLLGVAWTIKDNNEKRLEDERKSKIPFVILSNDTPLIVCKSNSFVTNKTFSDIAVNSKFLFLIKDFSFKVSQNSDCIPYGYMLNNQMFEFELQSFVEKNNVVKVEITNNTVRVSNNEFLLLSLVLKDVLGNFYKYECQLNEVEPPRFIMTEKFGNLFERVYNVKNICLPELIDMSTYK